MLEKPPRFDFTFSYWIFIWFLVYYFLNLDKSANKNTEDSENKFTIPNPKIWLILGLISNLALVVAMIYYKSSAKYMLLFTVINCLIKLIPIWLLRETPYRWYDFWAGAVLFSTYLGWLLYNGKPYQSFLSDGIDNIKHNKPVGPFMFYSNKFIGNPV